MNVLEKIINIIFTVSYLCNFFVPGYVWTKIFNYFTKEKQKTIEIKFLDSIVLSFIFYYISVWACGFFTDKEIVYTLISLILSISSAFIAVKIRLKSCYKKFIQNAGKVTNNDDIWYDIIDLEKGTRLSFFYKMNGDDVYIAGNVKYFEVLRDGDCNIALENYKITYTETGNSVERDSDSVFYVNSKKAECLEFTYGK